MRLTIIHFLICCCTVFFASGQAVNNIWLLGHQTVNGPISQKGTIDFSSGIANIFPTTRKMKFQETQGNISDANGNLLMSSNGIWIANATGDTMLNGSGLNPGAFTDDHKTNGLPLPYCNVILPWPGDTSKFVMFHQTGNYLSIPASELYMTVIDMTLDNGLGGVILKNQIVLQDNLSCGIGVCKHANGRDWWIVVMKDNSKKLYEALLTPTGISSVTSQVFVDTICYFQNANQPVFSPDGSKFAFYTGYYPSSSNSYFVSKVSYFNFDRCTGLFSNHQMIDVSDGILGLASMFSSSSKYLYASSAFHIYQINTDTAVFTVDTVAAYDGFLSPFNQTTFWLMYLAQDNKIYTTSHNGVIDLGVINYPDSAGMACNVQQHSISLPCYHIASVPNHPNYFLGADSGSVCDTLSVGIKDLAVAKKSISISPNPASGVITINATQIKGNSVTIYIYDALSNLMRKKSVRVYDGYVTQDVFIETFRPGIYIVNVEAESSIYTAKFVKQ
jgi:hypothetical protein